MADKSGIKIKKAVDLIYEARDCLRDVYKSDRYLRNDTHLQIVIDSCEDVASDVGCYLADNFG